MKQIDIDEDIYRYLCEQTVEIGESAPVFSLYWVVTKK
jgi:negative regulator of replication initiation